MVSLQTALSRNIKPEFENLLKRRRLNDGDDQISDELGLKTLDTELQLETPIPPEWQRCLDIKSGQIYFYNTRMNKRRLSDPRSSPEPPQAAAPPPQQPSPPISLDLELNLPCGSASSSSAAATPTTKNLITFSNHDHHHRLFKNSTTAVAAGAPSWLSFEGEQEMVAAACKKCHMLVMMSKSSPSCPNCKFMHPQLCKSSFEKKAEPCLLRLSETFDLNLEWMLSDPTSSPEPPQAAAAPRMSLDLELNLPCRSGSSSSSRATSIGKNLNFSDDHHRLFKNSTTAASTGGGVSRLPEMVAAACQKCHMLVMMCKFSPSCPNCKFSHPQQQSSANPLLKRRLSLLY